MARRGRIWTPLSKEEQTAHLKAGCVVSSSGCWEWQRSLRNGYGQARINKRYVYVHRLMFELTYGYVPNVICHTCDNRCCVNPDHFVDGDAAYNSADMVMKGRSRKGEKHHAQKLTTGDIHVIRGALASGYSQREIAKRFGVSQTMISRIALGKAWSHV